MAQKQIPGIETELPADEIDSAKDLMVIRDTSSESDKKVKPGTAMGRNVGTADDEVPTNSDVNIAISDHASETETHGAPSGERLVHTGDIGSADDEISTNGNLATSYTGLPIGLPFGVWDHLAGVDAPGNSGDAKFIRLTAGEDGAGQYNEGLLTNESVTGSAPLIEAVAEIAAGPLTGETVHLINTEESFLRARETSGELQFDQMQRLTGRFGRLRDIGDVNGVFSTAEKTGTIDTGQYGARDIAFDSADSPDARASSTTDGETRAKNVSATYYLRIA